MYQLPIFPITKLPNLFSKQPVKNIRRNRRPDQHENPDPALKNIVIMKQFAPGMPYHKMPKDELKKDGHSQPDKSDGPGLLRRGDFP